MASILHITDKDMIEFHRLNGNSAFNFWRPSSSKKFADFKKGDFLFFLAKGSERRREKGIIGYGRCSNLSSCSFDYMWKKYESRNGYGNKKSCYEAILKVSKEHKMPNRLNCIELDDVVFFSSPIYLSEFDMKISNKLESFTYIDKEDPYLSAKVINKANQFGIDVWTTSLTENESKQKLAIHALQLLCSNIGQPLMRTGGKNTKQFIKAYNEKLKQCLPLIGSDEDSLEVVENRIYLNIPFLLNDGNERSKLQNALGKYQVYNGHLKTISIDYLPPITIRFIINGELPTMLKNVFEHLGCEYKISAIQ